jgi:predicted DNA-binding antitoxin AbrB/MazE fold protein
MAKIELDEQMREGEKVLFELKQQFNMILKENLSESNNVKEKNYDLLRPTFGHPTKKNHLQIIDNQEKQRQEDIHKILEQLRSDTMVNKSRFKINMFFLSYRKIYKPMLKQLLMH